MVNFAQNVALPFDKNQTSVASKAVSSMALGGLVKKKRKRKEKGKKKERKRTELC